jgi:hypothetical protein
LFAVITSHFYIWFSCKIFVFEFWQWNAAISLTIIFFINMDVWISLCASRQIPRALTLTTI